MGLLFLGLRLVVVALPPAITLSKGLFEISRKLAALTESVEALAVQIGVADYRRMQDQYTLSEKYDNASAPKPKA